MVQKIGTAQEGISVRGALALIVVFGLIVSLPHLLLTRLEVGDETRVAGIAAEMVFDHDWLLPRLNGEPFLEYPPLAYQLMAVSYKIFGVNDAAARLPSMLFGLGGMMLAFLFALRLRFSTTAALAAAVILGTSAQYYGNIGKCTVDMQLAFFINLAVYAFYGFATAAARRAEVGFLLLAALGFLGGIATKGLIGLCLPGAVLGVWLVYRDCRERKIFWRDYAALAVCALAALALCAPWYLHIHRQCGAGSGWEALVMQNFGRFSGHQGDHVEPFYYYLVKLPTLFQPYLLLLLPALWYLPRRHHNREESGLMLPVIFVLFSFVLLSGAAGKRVVYLLMLALPCALTTAFFVQYLAGRRGGRLPERLRGKGRPVPILLTVGVLYAGGNWIYHAVREDENLESCFAECRKLEAQGIKLYLATDAERTRGAACFYLGRTVPTAERTACPGPGEAYLYRSRKSPFPGAVSYPDKHYLVSGGPAGSPGRDVKP